MGLSKIDEGVQFYDHFVEQGAFVSVIEESNTGPEIQHQEVNPDFFDFLSLWVSFPPILTLCVKRTSKEETEKLQKLLSVMKSQGWLPQEGSIRRLLCSDPSCPICNAMALEIQQLLGCENKMTSPTLVRPSKSFRSLEALSPSKEPFDKSPELCSQHSRDISLTSSLTPSQSTDQKSSTQSAAPSTGDASILYSPDHQQKQEPQGSNVYQGAGSLSSSSAEEPRVPANQQKKKKSKKLALKNQETTRIEPTQSQLQKTRRPSLSVPRTTFDFPRCLHHSGSIRFGPTNPGPHGYSHNCFKTCPQLVCISVTSSVASEEGTGWHTEGDPSKAKVFVGSQNSAPFLAKAVNHHSTPG
ncbi:FAM205C [Sigmodon hispidus]